MATPGRQIGPQAFPTPRQPIVPASVLNSDFPEVLTAPNYLATDLAEAAGNDTIVSQLRSAHTYYREGFEAVRTALRTEDPAKTEAAQYMDIKGRADKFLVECGSRGTTATEAGKRTIEALDNDIRARLQITDGSRSGEIRDYVSRLKKDERLTFAFDAIDSGDKETMAAILNGPAYLSGFTDDERATIRTRYAEVQAPDLIARKKIIQKVLDINDRAFTVLLVALDKIFNPDKAAEIAGRMNAAKAVKDKIFSRSSV